MAFYKHWFKKKVTKVEIEDRNKKQEDGLAKIFEIFKEVTGNHEKLIDEFLDVYELPEKEVLEFLKRYNLTLINNEAPVTRFERAKYYASLRKKYGFVLTKAAYNAFRDLMSSEYNLYLEFKAPESLNLNLETIEMFMQAASDIALEDTDLYGMYRQYHSYHGNRFERNIVGPGLQEELIKKNQPDGLLYAEPFEIAWSEEEQKRLVKEYSYDSGASIPRRFSYGEFQAIQVGSDPIIIASLRESMYKVLGHISKLPIRDSFEI